MSNIPQRPWIAELYFCRLPLFFTTQIVLSALPQILSLFRFSRYPIRSFLSHHALQCSFFGPGRPRLPGLQGLRSCHSRRLFLQLRDSTSHNHYCRNHSHLPSDNDLDWRVDYRAPSPRVYRDSNARLWLGNLVSWHCCHGRCFHNFPRGSFIHVWCSYRGGGPGMERLNTTTTNTVSCLFETSSSTYCTYTQIYTHIFMHRERQRRVLSAE